MCSALVLHVRRPRPCTAGDRHSERPSVGRFVVESSAFAPNAVEVPIETMWVWGIDRNVAHALVVDVRTVEARGCYGIHRLETDGSQPILSRIIPDGHSFI